VFALVLVACGPAPRAGRDGTPDAAAEGICERSCSADSHVVLSCTGEVIDDCGGTAACDPATFTCQNACQAAETNQRSVGCDYYATDMEVSHPTFCFAMFVANTWTSPAKIDVEYRGQAMPVAQFARIPVGSGPSITYSPYDPNIGLPPGEVAVLFLSGDTGAAPSCPVAPAVAAAGVSGTKIADAFHVTTDVPVVAYQINPFGGGSVAVTAASLLLPTSAWAQEYIAVNVWPQGSAGSPSMNIIARENGTIATLTPVAPVAGGGGISSGLANQPMNILLNKGQHAQITQGAELTGSVITANKPIGFMAGQVCMNIPGGAGYCDHGEQMVPPVRALGSRYVGVMYRPRVSAETSTFWRVVGTVDGTHLSYSTDVGGPTTLSRGQAATFETGTPFIVQSQDPDHPFMLFTYMTGSEHVQSGYGDPDFVVSVPPDQYLKQYVFFADPTYPETNLVVVRGRGSNGEFSDVTLDCAGVLTNWQSIAGVYEFTRIDLTTGDFVNVGACSTGRREIKSDAPFGLWVWGWGTPLTSTFTANVSYGYPGGMNVTPINTVILKQP
jgi:hypothetical protein